MPVLLTLSRALPKSRTSRFFGRIQPVRADEALGLDISRGFAPRRNRPLALPSAGGPFVGS